MSSPIREAARVFFDSLPLRPHATSAIREFLDLVDKRLHPMATGGVLLAGVEAAASVLSALAATMRDQGVTEVVRVLGLFLDDETPPLSREQGVAVIAAMKVATDTIAGYENPDAKPVRGGLDQREGGPSDAGSA